MSDPANATTREVDGKQEVYYDGYWIRWYEPPHDNLQEKKALIDSLTRRAFHHTESGINTPGDKLDVARTCYEQAKNPDCKRVNGAMLAGALFNRATDIFTTVVDLEEKGVHISQQKPWNLVVWLDIIVVKRELTNCGVSHSKHSPYRYPPFSKAVISRLRKRFAISTGLWVN